MSIKKCNIDGVTDSFFQEFLSIPGERQFCSELLCYITKGEGFENRDLLTLPNGCSGSPKTSPLGSPRCVDHLSPIFLPPSPRVSSGVSINNSTDREVKNATSGIYSNFSPISRGRDKTTHISAKSSFRYENLATLFTKPSAVSLHKSECSIPSVNGIDDRVVAGDRCKVVNGDVSNVAVTVNGQSDYSANSSDSGTCSNECPKCDISASLSVGSLWAPGRKPSKGASFSSVFNEAMGFVGQTPVSPNPLSPSKKRNVRRRDIVTSPQNIDRTLEVFPHVLNSTPLKSNPLHESVINSLENKENARPPQLTPNCSSAGVRGPLAIDSHSGLVAPLSTHTTSGKRLPKSLHGVHIPRFYYPMGRPLPSGCQEQVLDRVSQCFKDHGGQIQRQNMEPLMRACQLPLYWKAPLFLAAAGDKANSITEEQFMDYWKRVISCCNDEASRFVRVLSRSQRSQLVAEDFSCLVQDVVDTHPGLTFLKEATEFHSRYVHTVIARIFYCVNRSWSGKISIPELRRSNLLQVISLLEEEEDINKITEYFSYEHFYVIYCKFWELDCDHNLFIDRNDLAKHNDRALSDKIVDRIFSGAVTRGKTQKQDRMGYQDFVWFLISEEDKRHPTAIEYWFRCMDLDGDGFLSMYELEYFYEDQLMRMESLGIETLPFTDCLCQMLDMVRPSTPGQISLNDLKRCRMTPVFFDTFFNFDKYLDHEQRDPFASHRIDEQGPEISDWDRYAAVEYELLVAEEGAGDCHEDMYYGDEDELSMGVDRALDGPDCEEDQDVDLEEPHISEGLSEPAVESMKKRNAMSTAVPNLSIDRMDVDDDYADSDDYQY